jgi:hypothetical protein
LDGARQTALAYWLSDYFEVKIRDLCIDINTELPRFVIFYRKSKLEKYATVSWDGNTQIALKNMHCIQEDDWDKVDEKLEAVLEIPPADTKAFLRSLLWPLLQSQRKDSLKRFLLKL